jgi:splicing factor 3B subunit 2
VDEFNRPLYGDVFGTAPVVETAVAVNRELWGAITEASDDESSEESDSDSDSDLSSDEDEGGEQTTDASGFESIQSGITSISGLDTPDVLALRKGGMTTPGSSAAGDGMTVLQPQLTSVGDALMGTTHTYQIPSSTANGAPTPAEPPAEMNLSKRKHEQEHTKEQNKKLKF